MAPDWQKNWPIASPNYIAIGNCNYKKPLLEQKMTVDWQGLIRIGLDWTKLARIGMIGNFCWNGRMILDRHCNDMDWLGLAWIGLDWHRLEKDLIGQDWRWFEDGFGLEPS